MAHPNSGIREGLEGDPPLRLKPIGRFHKAEDPRRFEIIQVDTARQSCRQPAENVAHQTKVSKNQFLAQCLRR